MKKTSINCDAVYFSSDAHWRNFQCCTNKFPYHTKEYISICYLAAYPDIFKCFTLERQEDGPFDWYLNCLEDSLQEYPTGSVAALTEQTAALVNLALNLSRWREFDLAHALGIWDSELYTVALQAIDLRRHGRITIHEQI